MVILYVLVHTLVNRIKGNNNIDVKYARAIAVYQKVLFVLYQFFI
jgi:hypothetical protein